MTRPYKPLAFANEFIAKAGPSGAEHMKLQKLTYLAYGWWLAYYDDPILSEGPQVWTHGPVFKSLYFALRTFGRAPVTTMQPDGPFGQVLRVDNTDAEVLSLLDWIWGRYGSKSAYYLSDLTHESGSPWRQVAEEHEFKVPMDTPIPVSIIKEHYRKLATENGLGSN